MNCPIDGDSSIKNENVNELILDTFSNSMLDADEDQSEKEDDEAHIRR